MPQTKEQKKEIIEKLKENIDKQKSIVFVAYEGMKASDIFDLRKTLKKAECSLVIAKKTLLNIALKEKKINLDAKELKGQIGLIFGLEDEISPAKLSYKFQKENGNLKILGGFFKNGIITAENVIELAKLPSKQELIARFIGSISSSISGLANVLEGNIKGLINVLTKAKL